MIDNASLIAKVIADSEKKDIQISSLKETIKLLAAFIENGIVFDHDLIDDFSSYKFADDLAFKLKLLKFSIVNQIQKHIKDPDLTLIENEFRRFTKQAKERNSVIVNESIIEYLASEEKFLSCLSYFYIMESCRALESKDNFKALEYWAGASINSNKIMSEHRKKAAFDDLIKKYQKKIGKKANKKRIENFEAVKKNLKQYWQNNVNPNSRPTTAANKIVQSDVYKNSIPQPAHSTIVDYVKEWQIKTDFTK